MIFSIKNRRRIASYLYTIKTYWERVSFKKLDPINTIIAWGDSLTAGTGGKGINYPNELSLLTSIKIINKGIGGQTSFQIKNRMISEPWYYGFPVIIWVGRNNYKDGTTVKNNISEIISKLHHNKYLVLSIINADRNTEFKGTDNYEKIIQLNTQLQNLYGEHFIDIRSLLVSNFDSGNEKDVKNHQNDVVPSSLRSDDIHLNQKGYRLVAKLLYNDISKLVVK